MVASVCLVSHAVASGALQVFESSDEEEEREQEEAGEDIVLNIVVGSGTSLSNRPNLAAKVQVGEPSDAVDE